MSLIRSIHHVQFATKNIWQMYETFARGFGFEFYCFYKHGQGLNLVVKNGQSVLMFSEANSPCWEDSKNRHFSQSLTNHSRYDRPFNIALEVTNVYKVCERLLKNYGHSQILCEPVIHQDYHGKIITAIIQSCIPGLLHTIIDSTQYKGLFMPGYKLPELDVNYNNLKRRLNLNLLSSKCAVNYFDHITVAGQPHDSDKFIEWYRNVFEMKRIQANHEEDKIDGFVVKTNNTGMKLKVVGNVHLAPNKYPHSGSSFLLVLVESLENSDSNQVTQFLEANGGPGIQHIALNVNNIVDAVDSCRQGGISLLHPPGSYYDLISKDPVVQKLSIDLKKFQKSGVLLDPHPGLKLNESTDHQPILFQIFSNPLFEKNSFFMELIERHDNACGFGASNIITLWKAIEMENQSKMSSIDRVSLS